MRLQPGSVRALCALAVVVACGGETKIDGKPATAAGSGGSFASSGGSGGNTAGTAGTNASAGLGPAASGRASQAGAGASAAGRTSVGGSAGSVAAGGGGTPSGGLGGASASAGHDAGGEAGAAQGGIGGDPGDLGPPGADGFAVKVELASDLKAMAPTTVAIVQWSLGVSGLTQARIEFGLDTSYGMTAPVNLTRPSYRTVLVGMKPAKTYHFRIVTTDGIETYASDDRTLTTGAALDTKLHDGFTIHLPEKLDNGFFVASFWNVIVRDDPTTWLVFILDTDGEVVWWYRDPMAHAGGEQGYGRARLSADSEDMWLVPVSNGGGPLHRVSIDTLDAQTYEATNGSHDIAAVSGDTMAYLDYGETDSDSIFEIDKSGATKEIFESTSFIPMGNTWHGNAVRYSKKEDVYVYSDRYNDVMVVGRDGSLKWKLTDVVAGGQASWGASQHGIHLLDSSLLIFANDSGGAQVSQALEFALDGSVIKKFASHAGTAFLGDVQRLPSGNTLVNYGYHIETVDEDDTVVLEFNGTQPFGYMEFRQSLYGLPLDIQQ